MAAQAGEFLPRLSAVDRAEQGRVFNPGVDGIRIGQRRFEVPDSLELPGVGRAVVPLVSARVALVHELVTNRLPRLATIVGSLNDLWPNQPLDCDAYSRFGSTGEPLRW